MTVGRQQRFGGIASALRQVVSIARGFIDFPSLPSWKIMMEGDGEGLAQEPSNGWVALLLHPASCFYHELELPLTHAEEIAEVLPLHLEPLLPFHIEGMRLAFSSHPIPGGSSRVFVSCLPSTWEPPSSLPHLLLPLPYAWSAQHKKQKASGQWLYFLMAEHTFLWINEEGVKGVRVIDPPANPDIEIYALEWKKTKAYFRLHESCSLALVYSSQKSMEECEQWEKRLSPLILPCGGQVSAYPASLALEGARLLLGHSSYELMPCSKGSAWRSLLSRWNRAENLWRPLITAAVTSLAALNLYQAVHYHTLHRQVVQDWTYLIQRWDANELPSNILTLEPSLNSIEDARGVVAKQMSPYPLLPNLPTPRDTLVLLKQALDLSPTARLLAFDYTLPSHPTPKQPQTRYKAKVEVELEIPDLEGAQKIHAHLLQASSWIEKPHTLSWKAQSHKYHITFYLKDRTRYED